MSRHPSAERRPSSLVRRLDAAFHPDHVGDDERFRALLLDALGPGDRVLDLGAGSGRRWSPRLRGHVAHVAGADPDPAVLDHPDLDEARVVGSELPWADGAFDAVVSTSVLEHVRDPAKWLAEASRVLRPGGRLFVKTPNRHGYVALVARLTPHRFHEWVNARRGRPTRETHPTFYRCNTERALRRLAGECGLATESVDHWEPRPEYLRGNAATYLVGIALGRALNASPRLARFRNVLVAVLRKSN